MFKQPVQTCTQCGAKLSLDDMRKPNCGFCGTVFPHQATAAQHAQVVGEVMGHMAGQISQAQQHMQQHHQHMEHMRLQLQQGSRYITIFVWALLVVTFATVFVKVGLIPAPQSLLRWFSP